MPSTPVHFRPAGTNPALDEIPIRGANLQGKAVGCVAVLLLLCGGLSAFVLWNSSRAPSTAAVPTLAELPTETQPPLTNTPDAWALTGTAIYLATHTPTPTNTPTATETFSVDAWAATGTALFYETPTPEPETTADPEATVDVSLYMPLVTMTPYPTYTPYPPVEPRVIERPGERIVVTQQVRVEVPQPIPVTRIVPVIQTRIVPAPPIIITAPPTPNDLTATAWLAGATNVALTITAQAASPTPTPTITPTATVTRDADYYASATAYYGTVYPIWTATAEAMLPTIDFDGTSTAIWSAFETEVALTLAAYATQDALATLMAPTPDPGIWPTETPVIEWTLAPPTIDPEWTEEPTVDPETTQVPEETPESFLPESGFGDEVSGV